MKTVFRSALMGLLLMAASAFAQTGQNCSNGLNGIPVFFYAGDTLFGCPSTTLQWTPIIQPPTSNGTLNAQICHATYKFASDGGAISTITPIANCILPIGSTVFNAGINATTAGTSLGSATVAIGLSGTGGSTTSLLGATAVASITGQLQSAIVPQTASGWKKLTTAGAVTVTVAVAALTAGVIEVYVMYYVSAS